MSNFICSECGMTNIDCGRAGYKTPKEIELEKELKLYKRAIERTDRIEKCLNQEGQIKRLQEQLRIAKRVLENYANEENWDDCRSYNFYTDNVDLVEKAQFREKGYEQAKIALEEMEGVQ